MGDGYRFEIEYRDNKDKEFHKKIHKIYWNGDLLEDNHAKSMAGALKNFNKINPDYEVMLIRRAYYNEKTT